jgi:PadR family transcriptional regulator, regulatory protein PadR
MVGRRMREPTYFILAALLEGPRHGYAIIQEALRLSGGRVRLTAGTLYGALDRLAGEGLVVEAGEETVQGRRRRYHRLTEAGEAAVGEETAARLESARAVDRLMAAARLRGGTA